MASQNTNGEVSTDALSNNNEETEVCSTQLPEVDKVQTLRARKKAFRQSMHEVSHMQTKIEWKNEIFSCSMRKVRGIFILRMQTAEAS